MASRRPARMANTAFTILLMAIVATVPACVGIDEGGRGLVWIRELKADLQFPAPSS